MRAIAVAAGAGMAVVPLTAGPMRLHSGVAAAKVPAAAALTDGELRQPAFFLLPFNPRELRPYERPVHRSFFDFERRLVARALAGLGDRLIDIVATNVVVASRIFVTGPGADADRLRDWRVRRGGGIGRRRSSFWPSILGSCARMSGR